MKYLLDTNAWIAYLRQTSPKLVQHFLQTDPGDLALCSVVLAELLYGAYHGAIEKQSSNIALVARLRQRFASLPFDDRAADEYGKLRQHLASQGMLIGPNDLLIASIALANGLTLVTHNGAEFGRVPGLSLADWQ